MIALDCQCVKAQRRHPLHHSWLLEGVLSGFNHGGRDGFAPLVLLRTNGVKSKRVAENGSYKGDGGLGVTSTPTTIPTTTSISALPDFSSLFEFDQRVSTLETELSQLKQVDHSAQLLESVKSQLLIMVDNLLSTRIRYATRTSLQSYIRLYEKIAHKEGEEVLLRYCVVFAKSSSQPKSAYEEAMSLTEFELKKILLDKIKKSKSYQAATEHRELYDGLVKSYNLYKDLFSS
ncbi:hypothetical protein Tco_0776469 [Tanacetum coccineum]